MAEIPQNVSDIPTVKMSVPTQMSNNFKTNGPWYQFVLLAALCIILLTSTGSDLIYIFVCHDIPTYFKLFVFCWLVNLLTAFYAFLYAKSFLSSYSHLHSIVIRGKGKHRPKSQCQRCLENTFFIFFILSVSMSIILGSFILLNDTTSNRSRVGPIEKCESALYNNVEIVILVLKTAVFVLFVLTRVVFLVMVPESRVEKPAPNLAREDPGINNPVNNIPEDQASLLNEQLQRMAETVVSQTNETGTAAGPSGDSEANAGAPSFHMPNNFENDPHNNQRPPPRNPSIQTLFNNNDVNVQL
ncbi:hypothetical protein WR25_04244 [Diploscapter pachys]|uniref:Uncharacterized protein n=1 Tax=Diploscapter pachys TaxID=2018661 RepID=A0A2A2K1D7_9BILA|nr:hypothetical protein WR25_04244 [Diploscapter pachys]